ncbi:sugar porter family MFS transporter [Saccharopolyspora rhizosphaerae]|uniref:Sugar porter family MFS transporter n=1 Tax=Saccharopolyspora rhizosphaerae TaxID=2492662 RepID=A0A3R8Q045_9PSEU|nr:sugar porter family MFS transporter [Saccharopolyspora rhizosphaerae]RRO14109.1 sugar porter family MFS transporter [Saccharopolyspora rhizosphaerae]
MTPTTPAPARSRTRNALIWIFGALGGILWGYDTGVISGAMLFIKQDIPLSPLQQGLVVSGLLVGAMAGAGGSGRLADVWGRRKLILWAAVVFTAGTVGAMLATTAWMLVVFRFVIGTGVGIASVVVPLYLTELAPKQSRGGLTSLMQLLVTVGILLAYITDYALAGAGAWRWMLGLGAVPAVLLGVGIYFQPESPRWLVKHGRADQARAVLTNLRGAGAVEVEQELDEIQAADREKAVENAVGVRELLTPKLRRVVLLGLGLVFFQNFIGINTIIYYAPTLLTTLGFGTSGAILANVGIGLVNVLMTLPALRMIDRVGRKSLLAVGSIGMLVSMLALGAVNVAGVSYGPVLVAVTLGSILVYIASFAVSWGPVQWVMLPELFPLRMRGSAVGICLVFNWLFNMAVALVFPVLLDITGPGAMFLFFALMAALSSWFVHRGLIETKGKSLEAIEQEVLGVPAAEDARVRQPA